MTTPPPTVDVEARLPRRHSCRHDAQLLGMHCPECGTSEFERRRVDSELLQVTLPRGQAAVAAAAIAAVVDQLDPGPLRDTLMPAHTNLAGAVLIHDRDRGQYA